MQINYKLEVSHEEIAHFRDEALATWSYNEVLQSTFGDELYVRLTDIEGRVILDNRITLEASK